MFDVFTWDSALLESGEHFPTLAHLDVADPHLLSGVAAVEVTHDVLIIVLENPHDDISCGDALRSLRFCKLSHRLHPPINIVGAATRVSIAASKA